MVGVTCNLWIHRDDPSSFPLLSQSFAGGKLDPIHWTPPSGMGAGRQRAEAVARGKASATAQVAAENPTPRASSHNTGNTRSAPITAGQQPPAVGPSGGWKWSGDPWPSA